MKKIFLSIVLFFASPFIVQAQDVSVDVTDFLVDAYILDNGDMHVKEMIVAEGNYNWYERDILYVNSKLRNDLDSYENNSIYNASDISDVTIKAKYVSNVNFDTFNDSNFTIFDLTNYASNGDMAKYTQVSITGGKRFRTYYRTNSNKTAFLLEYTVKNVVVLHKDVAELYWTFVPDGFEEDLKNVQIKIHLPQEDYSDNFRFWAHGDLTGNISKIDESTVLAKIDSVLEGHTVDVRLAFNSTLVKDELISKKVLDTALNKIIEVEEKRADEANRQREELLRIYNFVKYGTILLYVILIFAWIFVFLKYGKSPKSSYFSKYNREFIDDYNVEVIDYLMNRKITPNAMSASIMNLIYKKNISAKEIVANEKSKKKDYEFTLENLENISESEKILIEFLFDKVGKNTVDTQNKKTFTTMGLKKYANGTKTCSTFISSYTKWKNNVIADSNKEEFFTKSGKPIVMATIIFISAVLLFMFGVSHGVDFIPTYLMLFFVIIFLFYCMLVYKKTEKGSLHYDKWKAFKNFLDDFGAFELKELPEIALWERYLVYATVFGLADKVQKAMNVRISELNVDAMGYDYYPSYVYFNLGNSINASVNNAINSAYSRQAANYANSHSSSSSGGGFGGGFSGGSGFGGGGGGGRFG